MFVAMKTGCCSSRDCEDTIGTQRRYPNIDNASLAASVGPSVIARITKLEQQMNEIRPLLDRVDRVNVTNVQPPTNIQVVLPDMRHPPQQTRDDLDLASVDTKDNNQVKTAENSKNLMTEVRAWNSNMNDAKARMEHSLSALTAKIDQTLSQVGDLKTSLVKRCDSVEARIGDLEEARAVLEQKLTVPLEPIESVAEVESSSTPVMLYSHIGKGLNKLEACPEEPKTNTKTTSFATIGSSEEHQNQVCSTPLSGQRPVGQTSNRLFPDSDSSTVYDYQGSGRIGTGMSQSPFHKSNPNPHIKYGSTSKEADCVAREDSTDNRQILRSETNAGREEFAQITPEYCFCESIWDVALFIGQPEVGTFGSFIIFILFVTNALFQVSFCIICQHSLNDNEFGDDTIRGLQDFRSLTGHDYRFAGAFGGASLMRRMCDPEEKFYVSYSELYATSQRDLLFAIDDYLGPGGGGLLAFRGELMCLLALFCWIFNVAREAKSVWHFHAALGNIQCGWYAQLAKLTHTKAARERIEIDILSYPQYAIVLMIVVMRYGICFFMIYTGCTWLSLTTATEDLLLNAVALEFVLSVDELIFAASVPRQTKVFVSRLAPIREKNWLFRKGVDPLSLAVLIVCPTVAFVFFALLVNPLVDQMAEARAALCSQELDFVFGFDSTGFMWLQDTPTERSFTSFQELQIRSLNQRLSGQVPDIGNSLPISGYHEARVMASLTYDGLARLNPGCNDVITYLYNRTKTYGSAEAHLNWFRAQLLNSSISSCADLKSMGLCSIHSGVAWVTRWLCATTCECFSPLSISPPRQDGGCPSSCETSGLYTVALEALPCEDMTLGNLTASRFWGHYATFARDMLRELHIPGLAIGTYRAMRELGCAGLLLSHEKDKFCTGTSSSGLRPMAPLCPITCECNFVWLPHCPPKCWPLYANHSHDDD